MSPLLLVPALALLGSSATVNGADKPGIEPNLVRCSVEYSIPPFPAKPSHLKLTPSEPLECRGVVVQQVEASLRLGEETQLEITYGVKSVAKSARRIRVLAGLSDAGLSLGDALDDEEYSLEAPKPGEMRGTNGTFPIVLQRMPAGSTRLWITFEVRNSK